MANKTKKGTNITKIETEKDTRKEVLFVVGREIEENVMQEIHFHDLNDFEWKYQNHFTEDFAKIYSN